MSIIIMKFGSSALLIPDNFKKISEIIIKRSEEYKRVVVVVSALKGLTDKLLKLGQAVNPSPPKREQDMLISIGERVSISLLAMALAAKKKEAISFTGSQSGIITTSKHSDALILEVRPKRIIAELEKGKIVIVAGFQGVSLTGEVTTLGRGGSDISAVALAAALRAEKVEFYKDVEGICLEDPKVNPKTEVLRQMKYSEALKLVNSGAKVLHPRCIKLAKKNCIALHVLNYEKFVDNNVQHFGTLVKEDLLKKESDPVYEI